jgi:hypothetical protein
MTFSAWPNVIKGKIPELQKLSAADKIALAAELSSNLEKMLSPSDSFTNPTDALKNIAEFPAEVVTLEEQKAKNRSGRR